MEAPARALVPPQTVRRGRSLPLGATWDGAGVNFALHSQHAERVELCLFDQKGRREIERVPLAERTDFTWHCYLPEVRPGQLYAYRVYGPSGPQHRFNPHKTLLDPYARMVVGGISTGAGRCRVVDSAFSWDDDRPPRIPWEETFIYEAHVKGLTLRHPEVPEQLRGTYAGLATAPVIAHLKSLGVTAVELLPVHAFVDDRRLVQAGLRNYWGYNSLGFFAPDMRYSATGTLGEFKTMVKTLHAARIEVILDVVYNHTGEGDHRGPTLSFRGIDNALYYRLRPDNPHLYVDWTGTGNTLDLSQPAVLQLVMDSLRYWVSEMHVDGFRFDLATTLARDARGEFDPRGAFLSAVRQDPLLAQVKLIAEPWDVGPHGYRVGGFPPGWSEWNDRYRDAVRSYWRGDEGAIAELASRIAGSADLFGAGGRSPAASINFVTAHDGFTLHDLVSYGRKHNEANLEDNRDGTDNNRSWNYGVEGPSQEAPVSDLRERAKRNLLATLLVSRGVPMLLAGDELGRTQRGNNNAYCQDNEISWLDWDLDAPGAGLLAFVRKLGRLRQECGALRKRSYERDIAWLTPHGGEMTEAEWKLPFARCLGARLAEDLLLLLNAHDGDIPFQLPGGEWSVLLDTADEAAQIFADNYLLRGRSLALLSRGAAISRGAQLR
ncbi:MAG TPA: glycogen debranching protein GlgX [Burkholderiales bacterium]|nr:glycogen debranching protein GlgX [Burkholderiales bacterium]